MKKIVIYIILFICVIFFIPIIFSTKFETKEVSSDKNLEKTTKEFNYDNYKTIKLLHTNSNQIEEVSIEEYIYNVVSAEMPAIFHEEALKAQSVASRTYTIYTIINGKGKHDNADICDSSTCCQAWISKEDRLNKWDENLRDEYWTKIVNAVNKTSGEIIMYDDTVINAVYHANSGGITEKAQFVWEGREYPYLQIVETMRRRKL